ncbi:hypothetical protein BKA65DRAFT_560393 [Rhexocercosporidium sp. MPI-PUGE-AT-0058]|nr:hypothetical protein BKA65DRAFT_560393 [Rhexocercosporidium sp. MPI-PUGE-AT-0058]
MPEFYAWAAVIISAACAAHSDAGFSGPRDPLYREYELPITLTNEGNTKKDQVVDYSARRAESLDDKLVAFERTAKHIAVAIGWDPSQYKAGLWMKDMLRQPL